MSYTENQQVRLPKLLNLISLPQEIRRNGITEGMSYDEKDNIVAQNNIQYTKQQYEKMGIVIKEEYDDLFWNVVLPEGWAINSHGYWSDLIDANGRKRANFFYKAAFYDRDAFINFGTRFHLKADHVAPYDVDYDTWKTSDYQGVVKDGDTIIFQTECVPVTGSFEEDDKIKDALMAQLENYMAEHYPNYKDIHAYWDEEIEKEAELERD